MKNFPKTIGCKQDLINLEKDFPVEVMAKLMQIETDAYVKVTRVISGSEETNDLVTEEIDNPSPMWQRLNFGSLADVQAMISELGEVSNG